MTPPFTPEQYERVVQIRTRALGYGTLLGVVAAGVSAYFASSVECSNENGAAQEQADRHTDAGKQSDPNGKLFVLRIGRNGEADENPGAIGEHQLPERPPESGDRIPSLMEHAGELNNPGNDGHGQHECPEGCFDPHARTLTASRGESIAHLGTPPDEGE